VDSIFWGVGPQLRRTARTRPPKSAHVQKQEVSGALNFRGLPETPRLGARVGVDSNRHDLTEPGLLSLLHA
jgi:hypothetical protein